MRRARKSLKKMAVCVCVVCAVPKKQQATTQSMDDETEYTVP